MVCSDSAAIANDFVRLLLLLSNTVRRPARLPASVKAQSRAFEVLFVLQNHTDKTVTMSQIAREARMSQQQLTKVITRWRRKGWSAGRGTRKTGGGFTRPSRPRGGRPSTPCCVRRRRKLPRGWKPIPRRKGRNWLPASLCCDGCSAACPDKRQGVDPMHRKEWFRP